MIAKLNLKSNLKRKFTIEEEVSHAISHGLGSLLGVVGLIVLLVKGVALNSPLYIVSMSIYGFTLILLYTNSSVYHGLTNAKAKHVFEKLDHLSIYCLIAGSYTPYMLIAIGGTKGIVICIIQWSLALAGVVIKAIWLGKYQKIHLLIYLAMGWTVIFFAGALYQAITPMGFLLLLLGGLAYSIGILFYVFRWFKYHHLVWHIFVLAGSVFHFFSIYYYVTL